MKKLFILAMIIAVGVCLTVGIIFAAKQRQAKSESWSTQSSRRTYVVTFSGIPSKPSWPFTKSKDLQNRKVTMNVSRDGKTIIDRVEVYETDGYDSNFKELYPDMEWFEENGLHLWNRMARVGDATSGHEIQITNKSGELLKYLYVKAGARNLFLLFDLPADAQLNLHTQLEHWEDLVGCEGQFNDRVLTYNSADFSRFPVTQSPIRYKVLIQKSGCSVTGDQ